MKQISPETRETLLYLSMRWHQLADETSKSEHNNTAHVTTIPIDVLGVEGKPMETAAELRAEAARLADLRGA